MFNRGDLLGFLSPSLRCTPYPGCGHFCGSGSYAGSEVIWELSLLLTPVDDPDGSFFVPWGPFLESPGKFSGPKSNIQIEI